jgi:hypothetical protein
LEKGAKLSFPYEAGTSLPEFGSVVELVDSQDYALFCEGRLADPYPLLHWLRDNDPVHFSPTLNAWIVTRYADVFDAFLDPRFLYDRVSASMAALPPDMQVSCAPLGDHVANWLGYTDPPKHTRLRGLVRTTFTPKLAKALTERITEITDDLIDPIKDADECDLVSGFAFPLPAQVICEILGIPKGKEGNFAGWSDAMVAFTGHIGPTLVDIAPRAMASYVELEEFFEDLVAERTKCPAKDLVSKLSADEVDGRLTRQELIGLSVFTLVAGNETTASLIASGLRIILDNQDLRDALRLRPDLYPNAIEEFLRLEAPIQFSPRLAGESIELRGKTIGVGDTVILHIAAANRDPEHFPEPDVLDLGRRDNRHLSFGWGAHFCLGAPLARVEAAVALTRLLERMPRIKPVDRTIGWRENMTIRAPKELVVRARA